MNITMQNIERLTLDQIREFVEGSRTIGFTAPMREAVYEFIEQVLKSQQYRRLSRGQKGIVRRFLVKMTGLSRAQLTRWIGRWMKTRRVQRKPVCRPSFPRRYTAADIALLAGVDAAHEDLSGSMIFSADATVRGEDRTLILLTRAERATSSGTCGSLLRRLSPYAFDAPRMKSLLEVVSPRHFVGEVPGPRLGTLTQPSRDARG